MESRLLLNAGRYEEAIDRLDRLLEIAGRNEPSVVAYERRMLTEAPHEVRGLCLFRLGRYTEAAAEYEQAAQFAPDNASYPVKREVGFAAPGGPTLSATCQQHLRARCASPKRALFDSCLVHRARGDSNAQPSDP